MRPTKRRRSAVRARFEEDFFAAIPLVRARSHGVCEVCGCCAAQDIPHHKKGRVGPDANDLDHLLDVCSKCHRMIHDNPKWAYERGYLIRRLGVWTSM